MTLKCINNNMESFNLTIGKHYECLYINGPFREVVNDLGKRWLYDADRFEVVAEPKPPLGVMPEWLYEEIRIRELTQALYDYTKQKVDKDDVELLHGWACELAERLSKYKAL